MTASEKIHNAVEDTLKYATKDTLIRIATELYEFYAYDGDTIIDFFQKPSDFHNSYFDVLWEQHSDNIATMSEEESLKLIT